MSRLCARGAVRSRNMVARIGVLSSSAAATPVAASAPSSAAASTVVGDMPLFIHDQRVQRVAPQFLAALEERQLDHERHAHDLAAELLDEAQPGGHRAA